MIRTIALGIFALAAMLAGSATAQELGDGVKVSFSNSKTQHKLGDGHTFTLKAQGKDKNGDGIYHIQGAAGPYLIAFQNKSDVGTPVGFSERGQEVTPTKWILHKNSTGWSLISAANGANTLSVQDGKLVLQRNQGAPHQVWQIEEK